MSARFISVVCVVAILGILTLFWASFARDASIENYPSSGTDIIAIGDSLTKGVGATEGNDYVSVLSKKIDRPIINLGVSGETTETALSHLSELNKYDPQVVIVLLGTNDFNTEVPLSETLDNLSKIIEFIHARGSIVLLVTPPYSDAHEAYENAFSELAAKHQVAHVRRVVETRAQSGLLVDELHPGDLGYKLLAEHIAPVLKALLR